MTAVTNAPSATRRPVPESLPLGRDSWAWRVNAEPLVFLGGGRALLLQVAHPGVGAGVEQHSSYERDPFGRLFRTVDVMMKLSFGTPEVSAKQARLLARMHKRVVGVDELGNEYDAMNAGLQLWVWATLVDTALIIYEQMHGALTPDQRDRYYQESKLVAYGCGVPEGGCPGTWGEFQAYFDGVVANDLQVTDSARQVAHAAMNPPVPWVFGRLSEPPVRLVTVGLMPPSIREQYGFEWNRSTARQLHRLFTVASAGMRLTPRPVRELGARYAVSSEKPLRIPWLQRRGAEMTAERMAAFRAASASPSQN